jgi:hypothetical protein
LLKYQITKEKDTEDNIENDDEKGTKSTNKNKHNIRLLDAEECINEKNEGINDLKRFFFNFGFR